MNINGGYAGYDNHAGSFSTGYPCWDSENYAKEFETVDDAKEWWRPAMKSQA